MIYDYTISYSGDFVSTWKVSCDDIIVQDYIERIIKDSILNELENVTITDLFSGIVIKSTSDDDYSWYIEKLVSNAIADLRTLEICYSLPSNLNCPDDENLNL